MKYLSSLRNCTLLLVYFFNPDDSSVVNFSTKTKNKVTTQNIFGYPFKVVTNWGKSNCYEYINPDEIIQLKTFPVKSNETAHAFIDNRLTMFKSVFEPKRVSYPGQYSRTIECPEKYKPKYFERNTSNNLLSYFLGYANNNKVAGACSDDLIVYKHLYGMLYCRSTQTIIEIEYFTNLTSNSTAQFIERILCQTTL